MDIQHDGHGDDSDPMEVMVVALSKDTTEMYTRYRLQETLALMGCRTKDAVDVTGSIFQAYHAFGVGATSHWPFESLQHEVYAQLAKLDYTKTSQLLDFDIAKEITQRNKSFVVLLGGTSGTGKSTLASLLASRLRLTTVLPTDSVRHISRAFLTKESHPCAFMSTYQAGEALTPDQVDELKKIAAGDVNTIMSENRLQKRKVLKGYKLQADAVLEKLDLVLTMFEKRKQSLVVEGVHLNTEQMVELVRRHPNCVPFVIYISNEMKHRERFAVRARHMTIDPQENKYIKYFDNIRIIQRHLCKNADTYLIPKIDNTNVDRSLVTIQSTLVRVLRKMLRGDSMVDEKTGKFVLLSREHESAIKKAWSSKGVRKAMRPLTNQKVSKRLLLRRLLAEQQSNHHVGPDSSSSDEEGGDHRPSRHDDDDEEQTTVVGSLLSFRDSAKVRSDGDEDDKALSTTIQQMALWRASQPKPLALDDTAVGDDGVDPEMTFENFHLADMKQRWRHKERTRSWFGSPSQAIEKQRSLTLDKGPLSVIHAGNRRPATKVRPSSASPKKRDSLRHKAVSLGDKGPRPMSARRLSSSQDLDLDFDSVSVSDLDRQDCISESSSHAENCTSPLASPTRSIGEMDYAVSSGSDDDDDGFELPPVPAFAPAPSAASCPAPPAASRPTP
ncbi:hypothetical protein SDRG_13362 [Saprolegnia diclina VS20]|uniref:Zeta toxin domain-containing protein n=1 Tax=Saprolegnia diclina (strain VS20) TaxID=1156394 RepID=T0Q5Y1_SAPDV|nr:hypothetical protein SDRG_13362 [Saprolegnia diclina VS20]EQC28850.1 hypothetical protein SDRG_13362 [Saprolegnia diclina VS20]|eukprot:XP_008617667.1 hypothetical protein SDRG_13362 [Saprolegnia diclina VS20]